MAVPSRVLEQIRPAAATQEALYTCPALRRASVRVYAAADTAAAVTVRLKDNGEADDPKQFLSVDEIVAAKGNERIPTAGYPLLLTAGDVLTVESDQADTTFQINGYEDDIPT